MKTHLDSNTAVLDDPMDIVESQRIRSEIEAEVKLLEDRILGCVTREYEDSRALLAPFRDRCNRYWDMFSNDYTSKSNESPYKKVNIPLLSRNITLLHANLSNMTIPDKQKMDCFRAIPKKVGPGLESSPELVKHAKHSEYATQQNMIDGCYGTEYDMSLLDLCVTGNQVFLMVWEQDIKIQEELVPNPEYDMMFPENNIMYDEMGNVTGMVEQFIWEQREYRSFDAPKARFIDTRNVFPSEIDINGGIAACYGVSIYDTTTLSELREHAIDDGGLLYANMDKLKPSDESTDVPEVEDTVDMVSSARTNSFYTSRGQGSRSVKKLKRITRFGRLDKSTLFPDGKAISPEAWEEFCLKFNIDQRRAETCKTWVVEIINGKVPVRIQPLPYKKDEIPIVHNRLFVKPNQTLGEGFYKLDEYEEHVYNFFRRCGLELTQKVVAPPIAYNKNAFDPKWIQRNGGKFKYKPDMMVGMRDTNDVRQGFNPMQWDAAPLSAINSQMALANSNVNALSHLPPVKQGQAGDSESATEAQLVAASSDVFLDKVAENIEMNFMAPSIRWLYYLEQQYRLEPQLVTRLDNAGDTIEALEIPPNVWLNDYAINIVGRRTIGNKAVQQMAIKEFNTTWMNTPGFNLKEAMIRHAESLDMVDVEALWQEPQPEGPPPMKTSLNVRADIGELPPETQAEILAGNVKGIEYNNDGAPDSNEMPTQFLQYGESVMNEQEPYSGGADPRQNHHSAGEVESRQRGLHDAEGVNRTLAQQTKDTTSGRRFQ